MRTPSQDWSLPAALVRGPSIQCKCVRPRDAVLLTLAAAECLATADTAHSCACVAIISALPSRIPRSGMGTLGPPHHIRVFESDT